MVKIVRAKKNHISDIGKLWLEFSQFHQDIDPIVTPLDDARQGFDKEFVTRLMKSKEGLVLVALDDEQIIGFSLSEISDPPKRLKRGKYGYIYTFAITASYRRKGVGEKMLNKIIKWFDTKHIDRIELTATTQNYIGCSFWEKQGFTEFLRLFYKQI